MKYQKKLYSKTIFLDFILAQESHLSNILNLIPASPYSKQYLNKIDFKYYKLLTVKNLINIFILIHIKLYLPFTRSLY